jgi:putative membrane protein
VAFGAAVALVVLAILLLSPTPYWAPLIPLDTLLAFGLGTLLCRHVPPLRRALLGQRRLLANVQAAARRAFERQGIDKTRDRSGLFVFVSLFERRVEVLTDVGIDTSLLSESYTEQLGKLQQSVQTLDSEQFLTALGGLKRPLAQVYPRRHDDLNELSNEVV